MIRQIIKIDREKCNGCGLCAQSCHEGAIGIVDGKAALLRDDYCDGLGNCLPVCPVGAISFEQREAAPFNEAAVQAAARDNETERRPISQNADGGGEPLACGCPGTQVRDIDLQRVSAPAPFFSASRLRQWPVQLKLVPANAPYLDGADLLIAADCTAYAYGSFHNDFIAGRVVLIGCPKLDDADYTAKLADVFRQNRIRSVTVVRMEVPCCGGIEQAARAALALSGKEIPLSVVTVATDGAVV